MMTLPRKWTVVELDRKQYFLGVHYRLDTVEYCIYLTDFSYVWIGDVDAALLGFKASQFGYDAESLDNVYKQLLITFENNFDGSDNETALSLDKLKVDGGVPLELKVNLAKHVDNVEFLWSFDLTILRDSTAITIMKNLFFYQSTIIHTMNEYRGDLVKIIRQKDNAIRYLLEVISGMNQPDLIEKWAPERSSNRRHITRFDSKEFESLWKKKKLVRFQNEYIWDILGSNYTDNTWSYGTTFSYTKKDNMGTKRPSNNDTDASPTHAVPKRQRLDDVESLSEHMKDHTINSTDTPTPTAQLHASPTKGSTSEESEREGSALPSDATIQPMRQRQTFGSPRKRTIHQKTFSPIKAAKRFHTTDE